MTPHRDVHTFVFSKLCIFQSIPPEGSARTAARPVQLALPVPVIPFSTGHPNKGDERLSRILGKVSEGS